MHTFDSLQLWVRLSKCPERGRTGSRQSKQPKSHRTRNTIPVLNVDGKNPVTWAITTASQGLHCQEAGFKSQSWNLNICMCRHMHLHNTKCPYFMENYLDYIDLSLICVSYKFSLKNYIIINQATMIGIHTHDQI